MVRSSCITLALCVVLVGCGDTTPAPTFRLHVDTPGGEKGSLAFPVAVVEGEASAAASLRVSLKTDEETYTLDVTPGTLLGFRMLDAPPLPVMLPGLSAPSPSGEEAAVTLATRLRERKLPARILRPVEGGAFLVSLDPPDEAALREVVRSLTTTSDLRFLVEVLPSEGYRGDGTEPEPPRLAEGRPPWPGTAEAFEAFKQAEIERYRAAQAAGRAYEPSDPRYFVLPSHAGPARERGAFAVLEWPAEERFRFDGRMLHHPVLTTDEAGRPAVHYAIRPEHRDAFHAWTTDAVGLPLAIVLDWEVLTAPYVRSPLRDDVQITLGGGRKGFRAQQAQAALLASALADADSAPATRFAALASWGRGGRFEVFVSLAEGEELRLGVEAKSVGGDMSRVEVPLVYVPGAPSSAHVAAQSTIAALLLGQTTSEEAAPPLRAWLPEVVVELQGVLADAERPARQVLAAELLGRLDAGSGQAATALLEAIASPETSVRTAAATALGRLEAKPEHLVALEKAVADPQPGVQGAAMQALAAAGGSRRETVRVLLRAAHPDTTETLPHAHRALRSLMPEARIHLLEAARGDDEGLRRAALWVLGMDGDADIIPLLVEALDDDAVKVRQDALQLLGGYAQTHSERMAPHMDTIAASLAHDDERIRYAAGMLLAQIGKDALPRLLEAVRSTSPEVRQAGLMALALVEGAGRDEATLEALRAALHEDDLSTRLGAVYALHQATGQLDEPGLGVLRAALEGEDAKAREQAVGILWMVGRDKAVLQDVLVPLLDDPDESVRIYAAAALSRMGAESEKAKAILDPVRSDPKHELFPVATYR